MDELLKVNGLEVGFISGKRRTGIVSGVSFDVKRGEVLALVGESGCGKSISCLSLTGLLPAKQSFAAGEVLFSDGKKQVDIFKLSPAELRKLRGGSIAYVFQEPAASLNPVMRIGDQIAEVIKLHRPEVKNIRSEVISLLQAVGIPAPESRIDAYCHELSGGMQQRVMIAMALAGNPDLLIADEPTTALDVTVQAQILDLLDKLRRERQMAVILITHNFGVVAQLADRVAVMYAGKIVESGTVRQILDFPQHPYTRALLASVPVLGGNIDKLNTIPGHVPLPEEFPEGCRFSGRCNVEKECCCDVVPPVKEVQPGHICCCHRITEKLEQ